MMIRSSLLLALLLSLFAMAKAEQPKAAPYDIEVILFERYGQGLDERWPQEPGEPEMTLAVGNLSSNKAASLGDASRLARDSLQLGPIAYTLKRKGAHVHTHLGWRQPVYRRNSPNWYRIGSGDLQGLISVTRGRFLHLKTDLLLQRPDSAQTYRIRLHRRMRSNELHYIDHPKVGIVVIAHRYSEDDAEEPAAAAEAPLQ